MWGGVLKDRSASFDTRGSGSHALCLDSPHTNLQGTLLTYHGSWPLWFSLKAGAGSLRRPLRCLSACPAEKTRIEFMTDDIHLISANVTSYQGFVIPNPTINGQARRSQNLSPRKVLWCLELSTGTI